MLNFLHYTIRPLELSDSGNYFSMVEKNRERLEDFFTGTVSRTKTYGDTEQFLTELVQKREARIYYPFVIENLESKELVGFIDVKNIDWTVPKGELGCYTDVDYAGKGMTSKAFHFFTDYCFIYFGFEKLFLRTHESNFAAQKLAERAGFQVEGKIRKDYKTTKGELVDLIYYGKLKEEML